MKAKKNIWFLLLSLFPLNILNAQSTNINVSKVTFPSLDSILISANIYEINNDSPVILLCHQALFNKFEYDGIAQKLNERGFNCIAIDQRSGGPISSMPNETAIRAYENGRPMNYLDAEKDIIAAINYAHDKYNKPIILWGSSYSSTLALYIAIENEMVSSVISFSPGDYFSGIKGSLVQKLPDFNKPMFITSSKQEAPAVKEMLKDMILKNNQIHFVPEGDGYHGSRALWAHQIGGDEYWRAIDKFLNLLK